MKIAKTRVVFDRHNTATKKVAAAIYIEVSYDRVRNFYDTGIKVCSHQFLLEKPPSTRLRAWYESVGNIGLHRAETNTDIFSRFSTPEISFPCHFAFFLSLCQTQQAYMQYHAEIHSYFH